MIFKEVNAIIFKKAYIGFKDSTHFHVFELTRQLPRFSMYAIVKKDEKPKTGIKIDCNSFVKMPIQERPQRVINIQICLDSTDDILNRVHAF